MCKCLTWQFRSCFVTKWIQAIASSMVNLPPHTEVEVKCGLVTLERPIRIIPYLLLQGEGISKNKQIQRKIMVRDGDTDIVLIELFETQKSTSAWRQSYPWTYQLGRLASLLNSLIWVSVICDWKSSGWFYIYKSQRLATGWDQNKDACHYPKFLTLPCK